MPECPSQASRLIIMRHGEYAGSSDNREAPLSSNGITSLKRTRQKLAEKIASSWGELCIPDKAELALREMRFFRIISSPYLRCLQTGEEIFGVSREEILKLDEEFCLSIRVMRAMLDELLLPKSNHEAGRHVCLVTHEVPSQEIIRTYTNGYTPMDYGACVALSFEREALHKGDFVLTHQDKIA